MNRPTMSDTRTYEDFSKFLGERPHRLGVVSRLYPELTATFLTESIPWSNSETAYSILIFRRYSE